MERHRGGIRLARMRVSDKSAGPPQACRSWWRAARRWRPARSLRAWPTCSPSTASPRGSGSTGAWPRRSAWHDLVMHPCCESLPSPRPTSRLCRAGVLCICLHCLLAGAADVRLHASATQFPANVLSGFEERTGGTWFNLNDLQVSCCPALPSARLGAAHACAPRKRVSVCMNMHA